MVRTAKITKEQAANLASKGYTQREIGKIVGCDHAHISRLLKRATDGKKAIADYNINRADVIDNVQAMALDKVQQMLDAVDVNALDKRYLPLNIDTLTRTYGILYDKGRLERGQSTSNVSLLADATNKLASRLLKPIVKPDTPIIDATLKDIPTT